MTTTTWQPPVTQLSVRKLQLKPRLKPLYYTVRNWITTNITLHPLLAKLYMTCFLFDMKFWQMDHVFANPIQSNEVWRAQVEPLSWLRLLFCLICYFVCAETTTVVLLALILYKIKFSAPWFVNFVHNLSFGRALSHFGHLYCACAETAIRLLSV